MHDVFDLASHGADEWIVGRAFVSTAQNQDHVVVVRSNVLDRGIHMRRFGVVEEFDSTHRGNVLYTMLYASKLADHSVEYRGGNSIVTRDRQRCQNILDVVLAAEANIRRSHHGMAVEVQHPAKTKCSGGDPIGSTEEILS